MSAAAAVIFSAFTSAGMDGFSVSGFSVSPSVVKDTVPGSDSFPAAS